MAPLTDKKHSAVALRVIELFRQIGAGFPPDLGPWIEFQLEQGQYDEIERTLQEDEDLWGFVQDKIR